MKQKKPIDPAKLAAAAELGLDQKLLQQGWGGLTSAETGRIGALLSGRTRRGGDGGNTLA